MFFFALFDIAEEHNCFTNVRELLLPNPQVMEHFGFLKVFFHGFEVLLGEFEVRSEVHIIRPRERNLLIVFHLTLIDLIVVNILLRIHELRPLVLDLSGTALLLLAISPYNDRFHVLLLAQRFVGSDGHRNTLRLLGCLQSGSKGRLVRFIRVIALHLR